MSPNTLCDCGATVMLLKKKYRPQNALLVAFVVPLNVFVSTMYAEFVAVNFIDFDPR